MPRIPFFTLGHAAEPAAPPQLNSYIPTLSLDGLQLGVDNLRHDVYLSPNFVEQIRLHIARLLVRYGNVDGLLSAEATEAPRSSNSLQSKLIGSPGVKPRAGAGYRRTAEPSELKPLLVQAQVAALNQAKSAGNIAVDLLARLAIIKLLRAELTLQFAQMLERCHMTLKSFEGIRQVKALEYRERVAAFQVGKRTILRQAAQELFRTLREIDKETLAHTRRSLFGTQRSSEYQLFQNPLIFTEEGLDSYLNAEHYVMLGTFERDADRFSSIRRIASEFLLSLEIGPPAPDESLLDGWLNVPENAQELVGSGPASDSSAEAQARQWRLNEWREMLEHEKVMELVIASYEVVPLLAEYSPRINGHQLKNALVSREERERVERLIGEAGGKASADNLRAAVSRTANCRGDERDRIAARFLRDFMRYHRDLRRLEAVNGALESINLIGNEKMRELSSMNATLYEFLLPKEHKPAPEKVLRHVIVKADVRDSSKLTRSLLQREMNPASYFSLNFYDPVNKLLAKYGAEKVFLEGDAIILGFFEREGDAPAVVGKACVMAREILEIVRGYNQLLEQAGLPTLELGIGISYQDSAPMYLMDGEQRVMISDALNESDRLSSCNKRARKALEKMNAPFNVYAFQTISDEQLQDSPEEFIMKYNLSGIRMSEAAFERLQKEISLEPCDVRMPKMWGSEEFNLYCGLVPVGNEIFKKIVVRKSQVARIDAADFSLQHWTSRRYYEVCCTPALNAAIDGKSASAR
ncbi:MAG: hypothetical protein JOY93_12915 [Acidobacteriales bacterium]|nr:hypothetical protein [Terriglobales bacterium]